MFKPFEVDFESTINLVQCMEVIKRLRTADSVKVLKTWVNGWCTSYRMHEDSKLPCLLGCSAMPDSLAHYVQCPFIYALSKFFIPQTSSDPLVRMGLVCPEPQHYHTMCCVFSGYHAVHRAVKSGIIHFPTDVHVDSFSNHKRLLWSVFAELLKLRQENWLPRVASSRSPNSYHS